MKIKKEKEKKRKEKDRINEKDLLKLMKKNDN